MEPDAELAKVLDECLKKIGEGKPIDVCVAAGSRLHDKVEPLLFTGHYISTLARVQPSSEFRRTAKDRLITRLQMEEAQEENNELRKKSPFSFLHEFNQAMQQAWQAVTNARRIVVPVAIGLILVIVSAFSFKTFMSPAPALADGCTLSIISGAVEVSGPEVNSQAGIDGMTLEAGTHVKTAPDSSALLTFFDGSTVELKPDTDIEIQQLKSDDGQAVTIVLKQWVGRTWSTVVKMADKGSRYEIDTPSAVALVRGTQFLVDVDNNGSTVEHTTRGLVSVFAEGEEVLVPPGQATFVETGAPPAEPQDAPEPEDTPPDQSGQQPDNKGGASTWAQNNNGSNAEGVSVGTQNNGNKGGVSDWAQSDDKEGNASDWGQNNGNANGNSGGDNNGNANGNSGGENNGNANGNSGGDNNGNANGNSGGENNGNANGNSGGENNGNGNTNGNSDGENNGNANGNSGGENNGNGNDNGNSGEDNNGNNNGNSDHENNGNGNADNQNNGNGNDKDKDKSDEE
jgi:hypothetical protein